MGDAGVQLEGGENTRDGWQAPRLVGRNAELDQVRRWLAAAAGGHGSVVVLQGDAGIGKTRLVGEIVGDARARGVVVRASEAGELDQTRPFGAISDALGVSPRSSDPALAELAQRIEGHGSWSGRLEDVSVEVHRLIEALIGVFESLCTTAELLLVVDNLHWADSSSLAMLRRLSRLCRQYPALILATTRATDKPAVVTLLDAVRQGGGGAVLDLGPLDTESVFSLAGQLAGGPPGPHLADRVAQAAGNPLFVVELLGTLVQQERISITPAGHAEVESSGAPAGLAVSILHRLSLLPADSIELLRVAAICGRTVDMAELSMLANRDTLALAESLRAAARAGIIETSGDRLSFRHELIHDALYQDWPLPVRRSLHRELAERLAASDAPAWRVAHHLSLGAQAGDVAAVAWLHRAGLAVAPRDPAAAVSLLGRAIELTATDATRDVIRTDLSVALVWAGHTDEGVRLAAAVVADTLDVEVRGRAASWLASSLLVRGRAHEARDLCGRALASGVGSGRVEVLLRMVKEAASIALGDRSGVLDRMRQLLAVATELGDAAVRSMCLQGLALAQANAGHLDAAAEDGAGAVRDAESANTAEAFMANSHVMYAWILEEQDRLAEAFEVVGRFRTLAGEKAESPVAAQIERWTARAHFAAGRWDEAVVDLDSALRVYDAGVDLWPEPFALRALIAVHRGQLDCARADLGRFDAAMAAGGSCFVLDQPVLARAFVLEAEGQVAQAVAVLAAGWEIAEAAPVAMAKPTIGPQLARLAARGGDLATAHRVGAALDALAVANPAVARLHAAARWAIGIARADAGILLEAVEFQRAAARPFDLAMVREDAAAALARDGRLDRARDLLEAALAGYEGLPARQRSAAARARLRALGLQLGSTGRRGRPATGWKALTNAEVQIFQLVGARLSNQEIAERLFVSRRTVETHVSHTLAKLGYTTRRELIAVARERSGTGDP